MSVQGTREQRTWAGVFRLGNAHPLELKGSATLVPPTNSPRVQPFASFALLCVRLFPPIESRKSPGAAHREAPVGARVPGFVFWRLGSSLGSFVRFFFSLRLVRPTGRPVGPWNDLNSPGLPRSQVRFFGRLGSLLGSFVRFFSPLAARPLSRRFGPSCRGTT